jgi:hypothetical protein
VVSEVVEPIHYFDSVNPCDCTHIATPFLIFQMLVTSFIKVTHLMILSVLRLCSQMIRCLINVMQLVE